MSTAPRLSESDVRLEVERLFRREHRSRLVALYGRGEAGRFEWDGKSWEIVPTTCELDMRARLPRPGDDGAQGRVYLVDWVEEALPLDVACRLAGGRLYHVARDARLMALFGARQVEPGLAGTALARLLVSGAVEGLRKVSGLRLTRDEAWRRFLEARLGMPEGATAEASAWLRWVRRSEGGPAFARACEADDTPRAVRRELLAWLADTLGPVGELGWRAWETGAVERLLQVQVLLEAAEATEDAYARGLVGGQSAGWLPGLAAELRAAQGAFAEGALLSKVLELEEEADRRLLEGAEQLAQAGGVGAVCAASAWLPAGHAAREQVLARKLEAFVAQPSSETLTVVFSALERLAAHRWDGVLRRSEHAEARRMAARLGAWLLGRRVRLPLSPHGTSWQPAVELARRYAEEGGYLDWARQTLRGMRGASAPLEAAVRQLLAAVEAEARQDDQRFAEAYVAWLEAGKPANEALPIEHVTRRMVVPFLQGRPHRKLLLVLMDGMSQATAVQLLHRLREQRRWSPLAWRMPGWSGDLPLPPVLAVAPTLTELSRAALFAGVADPRFGDQGTDRDAARWAANSALRELAGEEPLKLFVRADIQAGHELADEVKHAVAGEQRVVAVVVNAMDEQLKGSIQVGVDYSRNPILPLEALLSAAEGAERAVLLVADHGHVPGDVMRVVGGRLEGNRPGGARWRALAEGEQPLPEEVALPRTCWKPRGWAGVAVLWEPGVVHRAPHHGEHGGLSLAEAVAPAFLVGPDWLDRVSGEDTELSVHPPWVPDWWELRLPRPRPVEQPAVAAPPVERQLTLLPVATAPASAPVATPMAEPSLLRALRASRAFNQHVEGQSKPELERVLGWLGALIQAGGAVSSADFARLCGVRAHQVGGVVARMGILNADGFAIVEHDVAGRRVVLHRARLMQQFGVSE